MVRKVVPIPSKFNRTQVKMELRIRPGMNESAVPPTTRLIELHVPGLSAFANQNASGS
ncbi:MAG: hypothetical protein LAO20_21010 [Acidobacteriia bacterium]|nr:hypothetical protein [Terriglobia bacterium]